MGRYKKTLMRLIPIAILLVATVLLSELFYRNLVESTKDSCWQELSTAHREASREIGTRLNSNITILDLTADALMMNADLGDKEAVLDYLLEVQSDTMFDRIDVVYPNGTILVQNGSIVEDKGEKTFDELVAKGSHISQRVPDFLNPDFEVIHTFSTVYDADNSTPIALLGATISCSTLADVFKSAHYGEGVQIFLVDRRDGKIVLDKRMTKPGSIYDMQNYNSIDEYKDKDFIADILAGNTGTMAYESQTYGKYSYTYYAPVENTDYSLTMVVQEEVVFAAVNDLRSTLMWVGIIEVALLAFFAIWIYNIMRKSMQSESRANKAELALLHQKELELQSQYDIAADRKEFLELMAANLPGGYHRCTTDYNFSITFMSKSFTQVTGYTMEQLKEELNGSYMGIVADQDREYFMSLAPQLERDGFIHCGYRIRRRDGSIRWVKDTTQYFEHEGEKYYQCALMDITAQIEEIEKARHEAEASSQAKSMFLFNISHDIRTPMNAIKGFSHIIEQNADNPQLIKETIVKVNKSSDALMMLMNDVLDISRIERGKDEVKLQLVNLSEQGKNLYEMFSGDMEKAGIRFVRDGEDLNEFVYCDHLKLTRVLMNMLSNAKKFTPAGGTVTFGGTKLSCDEKSCTYRFFVRDTGIGMSEEFQKRAFEQFERERTSTESGIAGSGLGLAIIKMFVELMGGTVGLKSEMGKGTEISATLTFKRAVEDQTLQTINQDQVNFDMKGKRVLVVEDNDFNREIVRYMLEGMQLVVDEAVNGVTCIEKLNSAEENFYDLILMDIQMPIMDGLEASKQIRNSTKEYLRHIPIIALTANAFTEDIENCLAAGMNAHLAKPFKAEDLIAILKLIKNNQ